jgi:signal transduction histidine kinase
MVGHDLRNPLTGIKGAIYYLKTKYGAEADVKGKEMFEVIDKDINYSNKIINDLLDYSRDPTLEPVNTTPKLLLKNVLSLIEVPERIKIIDATEDKPKIKADGEKMKKAFVNIITNAIDAMPDSGTLTVTSKAVKGNVEIVFKDTGTGMAEETLSKLKLWSPLFTTKAKGMGFGLPVCKRIVEAHSGKISVESTIGKGTTVTITIPVNPPVDEDEEKWIFNEPWLSKTPQCKKHHER